MLVIECWREVRVAGIDRTYDSLVKIARAHGVRRLILFGSRARGDAFQKSDIDLAVEGCGDFAAFWEDVQENLWSLLTVDIVNLDDEPSKALLEDIRRDGKVLYEKV